MVHAVKLFLSDVLIQSISGDSLPGFRWALTDSWQLVKIVAHGRLRHGVLFYLMAEVWDLRNLLRAEKQQAEILSDNWEIASNLADKWSFNNPFWQLPYGSSFGGYNLSG